VYKHQTVQVLVQQLADLLAYLQQAQVLNKKAAETLLFL
jgi:cytochrome c1